MYKKLRKTSVISKREEISFIFKNGLTWKCPFFTVKAIVADKKFNRFAVLVSKKIGNAVKRNRVKRLFREVFRLQNCKEPPFLDILILPHRDKRATFKELEGNYISWQKSFQK